ncbi:MAG: hypothetical protein ACRD0O_22595 [Acidimicrobiia bacterium]
MAFLIWLRAEWDRVLGFALVVLGAVVVFVGYEGVSGSPFVVDQLSYLMSGGIVGLFLLGTGATLILLADLHDEWRKLDRVETQLWRSAGLADSTLSHPGSARPDE